MWNVLYIWDVRSPGISDAKKEISVRAAISASTAMDKIWKSKGISLQT